MERRTILTTIHLVKRIADKCIEMIISILYILGYTAAFYAMDAALMNLEGKYYAVHALHNAAIVWSTGPEVLQTLTDFSSVAAAPTNFHALQLCFALHFYHIAKYYKKFRADDWLHHILMIGIALPIGGVVHGGTLLGYSLFFTTGLPGGIDYVLLFLTRNGWLHRDIEKRANVWMNVWIRSPGTASLAALVLAHASTQTHALTPWNYGAAVVTAALNFWNGQYFMQQVVLDAGQRHLFLPAG